MMKYPFLVIGISGTILLMCSGTLCLVPNDSLVVAGAVSVVKEISKVENKVAGIVREVTAYNVGVREQTSDNPCIGAGGHDLCELARQNVKICAANFVPLGTILHIEGYGEFVVLDRTHRRFSHRVDIAMKKNEIREALKFGLQKRLVAERL